MGYGELIKKVEVYSGFSSSVSKDALDCLVEALAVRLSEPERKDFASHLPEQLQDMALAVYPSEENANEDIINQFMEYQHVQAPVAKRQILSAWQALKDIITNSELDHIRALMPNQLDQILR